MNSIKCPQCGLVNFKTATHCKRCEVGLNDFAPIAEQRNYQTPSNNFKPFQMPPPPPVFHGNQTSSMPGQRLNCATCGGVHNVSFQKFKKDYIPPIAYIGFFIGLLPLVILILVLKTRHKIDIPFCPQCWQNYRKATILSMISSLGFLVGLIFAIFLGILAESLFIFFLAIGFVSALYIWGYVHTKKVSPKIKKLDRKHIIIDAPVGGELCFYK